MAFVILGLGATCVALLVVAERGSLQLAVAMLAIVFLLAAAQSFILCVLAFVAVGAARSGAVCGPASLDGNGAPGVALSAAAGGRAVAPDAVGNRAGRGGGAGRLANRSGVFGISVRRPRDAPCRAAFRGVASTRGARRRLA